MPGIASNSKKHHFAVSSEHGQCGGIASTCFIACLGKEFGILNFRLCQCFMSFKTNDINQKTRFQIPLFWSVFYRVFIKMFNDEYTRFQIPSVLLRRVCTTATQIESWQDYFWCLCRKSLLKAYAEFLMVGLTAAGAAREAHALFSHHGLAFVGCTAMTTNKLLVIAMSKSMHVIEKVYLTTL